MFLIFQLRKKNKELQRAQAKNQDLEQELAFMKIDNKFEPLNVRYCDYKVSLPIIENFFIKKNQTY